MQQKLIKLSKIVHSLVYNAEHTIQIMKMIGHEDRETVCEWYDVCTLSLKPA